jgi:hypothetical protein
MYGFWVHLPESFSDQQTALGLRGFLKKRREKKFLPPGSLLLFGLFKVMPQYLTESE